MNITGREFTPEELEAIKLAHECNLIGNTGTESSVARFVGRLKTLAMTRAERRAFEAMRSVAAKIVAEYAAAEQQNPELFYQASSIGVRVRLLVQLRTTMGLTDFAINTQCDDLPAMMDNYEALRAYAIKQQQRADRAERALTSAGYTYTEGARDWRRPIGPNASRFLDEIDRLRAQVAEQQRRAESAESGLAWWVHVSAMAESNDFAEAAENTLMAAEAQEKLTFMQRLDRLREQIAAMQASGDGDAIPLMQKRMKQWDEFVRANAAPMPHKDIGNLLLDENGYPHIQPTPEMLARLAADLKVPVQHDGSVDLPPGCSITFIETPDVEVLTPSAPADSTGA